jgi:DNA-binding response OmpR family regulator
MVQRLRAKLEIVAGASRCIQTVRGFGYRCVPADEGEPARP